MNINIREIGFVLVLVFSLTGIYACTTPSSTGSLELANSENKGKSAPSATIVPAKLTNTPIPITDTPIPSPTSTPSPTNTPTPTPSLTPTVTDTPTALPASARLSPLNHQWQTLNNCHRASIATLMAYYDVWFTQHDYDLGMDNLDEFVASYGLTARVYGVRFSSQQTSDMVRWLLAEDIPVIVGQDLSREDNTWHYRVAYGYNDATQEILLDDPLLGPNLRLSYERFNSLSRGVGQIIPVYPSEMDERIQAQMRAWQMKLIEYP